MYEVIWSVYSDAYIWRSVNIQSTIKPLFVGTLDECTNYIVKNTTH
jgi:hypothetical protein